MDSRLTFLHMWGFKFGLEKDSDGGQWLSPGARGNRVSELPVRREQGHASMLPRKIFSIFNR